MRKMDYSNMMVITFFTITVIDFAGNSKEQPADARQKLILLLMS